MSFINTQYIYISMLVIFLIALLINRLNAKYFDWIKTYWFFDRTWSSRIASLFYLLSLFLFLLSLLDLRGPERKMRSSLPDQQTIILIDASASMLAEDVRPNRFVKSLQLARHFVKSSPGHQISIVLFSDIQKRLIPFTDDVDLLDSRLAALEKTNSVSGGSNISQAIEETIGYFENDSADNKGNAGNILVFTDAEESEGEFNIKMPRDLNLAVIGVGTAKGSQIPLRWEDGSFRGYKTFKGEPVITKLDEAYIKKMGKNASNYKYWIANSYSLPTDEILDFFRAAYNKKQSGGNVRVRPVYSHYILIPAIIIYCLSVLVGRLPLFKMPKSASMIWIFFVVALATQVGHAQEEKKKELSPELKHDLEQIKTGKADREFVLKTAEKMLKAKEDQKAVELYKEYTKDNDAEEIKFNYATSLLKAKRNAEAMPLIQQLLKKSKNENLKNKLRSNVLLSLNQQQQQQQQNKDQNKEQNKDQKQDQNKDQNKDQQDQKPQNKDGKENNNQDKKDKEGKQDSKEQQKKPGDSGLNEKNQKEKDKKDQKKNDQKKDNPDENQDDKQDEPPRDTGPKSLEEKEKQIEQKRRMIKTPAMIKQILSDDRDLQKKMMDTSTNEKGKEKPKRDW